MDTVSKRELNQWTAAVLDRVTDTHDVVVTERYTPPASEPAAWPSEPGGPTYTEAEAEALLDEMRGGH